MTFLTRTQVLVFVLLIGFVCFLSTASVQAEDGGWYWEARLGQSLLGEDVLTAQASNLPAGNAEVDYETGFDFGFALGRDFGARWRAEGEYLYRTDELGLARFADGTEFDGGDMASVVIAANLYYDFPVWQDADSDRRFEVYLGAGVGWIQEVDIDLERAGEEVEFETDDFGYQWMVGLVWHPSPKWALGFELRQFEASDLELESEEGRVFSDYGPVNLNLSLRFKL